MMVTLVTAVLPKPPLASACFGFEANFTVDLPHIPVPSAT